MSFTGITGVQISNGSVTIPVQLVNSTTYTGGPYNGNDKNIRIYLSIKSSASFTINELGNSVYEKYTINSVNFNNGIASAVVGSQSMNPGGTGDNPTSKTVTITGLPASANNSDIMLGLFADMPDLATMDMDALSSPPVYGMGTIGNTSATVYLFSRSNNSPWTETGYFYVGFFAGGMAYFTEGPKSFSGNNVNVTAGDCYSFPFTPPEGGGPVDNPTVTPKTVTITGLPATALYIEVALFATLADMEAYNYVAGNEWGVQNGTATVQLYSPTKNPWTGTGYFYIGIRTDDGKSYYTPSQQDFSGNNVTLYSSDYTEAPGGPGGSDGLTQADLTKLIAEANAMKTGITVSPDGTNVSPGVYWVTQTDLDAFNQAIAGAQSGGGGIEARYYALVAAMKTFEEAITVNIGTTPEPDQKTVTFTGLSAYANGAKVMVALYVTRPTEDYYEDPVAFGLGNVQSGRVIAPLCQGDMKYFPDISTPWAGTGDFYVYVGEAFEYDSNPTNIVVYITRDPKQFPPPVFDVTVTAEECDIIEYNPDDPGNSGGDGPGGNEPGGDEPGTPTDPGYPSGGGGELVISNGILTLTGFDVFNGKYVYPVLVTSSGNRPMGLIGAEYNDGDPIVSMAQISGGRMEVPLYISRYDVNSVASSLAEIFIPYESSETITTVSIAIVDVPTYTCNDSSLAFLLNRAGAILSNPMNASFSENTTFGDLTISRSDAMTSDEIMSAAISGGNPYLMYSVRYILEITQ
jgi:hypothetical protein